MTPFDRWLTTQPDNSVLKQVDCGEYEDDEGDYVGPVDEWKCDSCRDYIGAILVDTEDGPAYVKWIDCWQDEEYDKLYCEGCAFAGDEPDNDEGCGKWGCKECYPGEDEE